MNFKTFYSTTMRSVNKELEKFMNKELVSVANNPFLEFYYQKINSFLFSGGKRIRPILMILSFKAIEPDLDTDIIRKLSLSIELLHNASLIHDDIMDYATTRRGEKAFHVSMRDYAKDNYSRKNIDFNDYGLAMGILGGDCVYNLSYKILHQDGFDTNKSIRAAVEFNKGFMEVVKGVIFETDMQGRFEVTEKQYIEMVEGKTAALFETAAKMGSIYAGAINSQIKTLGSFAKTAGIAFQIVDDIIGTFGKEKQTGKPSDSDIKEGKKTILLIKSIEQANEEQKKILLQTIGNRNATDNNIDKVREIMKETGALDYAKRKSEELFEKCKLFLEDIDPKLSDKYKNYLIELAKLGINRQK